MDTDNSLTGTDAGARAMDRHVPGVGLPLRLYATPAVHRLVPAALAFRLAALRARVRERRNPHELRAAREMMGALLAHTPRAGEADALARRWMAEKSIAAELFWRPWLSEAATVEHPECWHLAKAQGRGVILAFGHLTPDFVMYAALPAHGMPFHIVIGPHYYAPKPAGYAGLEIVRWIAYGDYIGAERWIEANAASTTRMLELLAANEAVAIAFDAPGRTPTPFLGRTVALGAGPAKLAAKSGAMILPVTCWRDGTRTSVRFDPPIDPREHPEPADLRRAIAEVFERHFVARPDKVHLAWDPLPLVVDAPVTAA